MTKISEYKSQEEVLPQGTTGQIVLGLLLSALNGVMLLLAFLIYMAVYGRMVKKEAKK